MIFMHDSNVNMKGDNQVYELSLCPHVIVLGLERFNDLWGYAGRAYHA